MKIEFEKISPPYSFPASATEVKEIVNLCIPPEILPRIKKIHFGCNQQTTQEARIVGRGSSFEIRINFCPKEGKTKLLSEKRRNSGDTILNYLLTSALTITNLPPWPELHAS